MKFHLGQCLTLAYALALSPACAQTYVATDLTPTNSPGAAYLPTVVNGVASPYQIGSGLTNGQPQALAWNGTPTGFENLTPAQYKAAAMYGVSTSTFVGYGVTTAGQTEALLWPGPVPSVFNLNPVVNGSNALFSQAFGISTNQIVGCAGPSTNAYYAVLWPTIGTNVIDLHPAGYLISSAIATDGTHQVGYAIGSQSNPHASLWFGSSGSFQDLNPNGYLQSFATGVARYNLTNSAAVGYAESTNASTARAYAWPNISTSNSTPVNLQPTGYLNSFAYGISSTNVVGYGTTSGGAQVALLWRGLSTNSVVNLSTSLPGGATNAVATSIDSSGNIGGYATIGGQTHAILWQPAVAPTITSSPINTSTTVGILYYAKITANGTPSPSFSATNAPPGITMASSGTFTGTPTTSGTYTGTFTAANGISPNANQAFSITVNPTPVQSYAVLHSFLTASFPNDGTGPNSALLQGSDGNFYGMTFNGGTGSTGTIGVGTGAGTIFRISPGGSYSILHNFNDGSVANDGINPSGSLIEGTDGNYYGVTQSGGVYSFGTVFRMTPQGAVTILHNFAGTGTSPRDGAVPGASLVQASDGNLYGTTIYGSNNTTSYNGTLFRISPSGSGYAVLHSFKDGSVTGDGTQPGAALIQASNGNLYSTTTSGGSAGYGTLYEMTLQGSYSLLRSFGDGTYGFDPEQPSALVQGADTDFYGTAPRSYSSTSAIAFKMTLVGSPTVLHTFGDGSVANDGTFSGSLSTGLTLGADGNYYGTTVNGGQPPILGYGALYRMTPAGAITTLHVFANGAVFGDGAGPEAPPCQGFDGNFYGTASYGGTTGNGALYQVFLTNGVANPVAITSTPAPSITAGATINFTFTAQGSPAPTFSYSGTLPPGLNLSPSGVLSGTPTTPGSYTFTVLAGNGTGAPVSQTVTLLIAFPASDTPVMPPWGLALLAALLVVFAILKPRTQLS
jgi:uncharacterized repeat protein (TIGR03803 family)